MTEEQQPPKESFYKKYMKIMGKIGDYQGRGLLILLYFTIFGIPGAALSAFGDRLQIKKKPVAWQDKTDQEDTIERAKEQW